MIPFNALAQALRTSSSMSVVCGAALLLGTSGAQAAFNAPISFSQGGTVSMTLDFSTGGLDHVIELASTAGPVGTSPLMTTTESGGSPSASVLGFTPASPGDSVSLGSYVAGTELVLRLTNVESNRLGTPGMVLAQQLFTGSSNSLNAQPDYYNTFVETLSPTSLRVTFEDLFPIDPNMPIDPNNPVYPEDEFFNGKDVVVTLTLSPVPEPSSYLLMGAGMLVMSALALGRARRPL